jgi:hypothetical protein
LTANAGPEVRSIPPTAVDCGASVSCAFSGTVWSDMFAGVVKITPQGSGLTSGTVTLTMPFKAITAFMCSGALAGQQGVTFPDINTLVLPWNSPTPLAGSTTYDFLYHCTYQ